MVKLILFVLALMVNTPSMAGVTRWEALDFKSCRHWAMTPDDFSAYGSGYQDARDYADEKNQPESGNHWHVLEGGILYEDGENLYGVCRVSDPHTFDIIECVKEFDFPLSGATYQNIYSSDSRRLPIYKCIRGCKETKIQAIYDMGYEADGGSVEFVREHEKFDRLCHEKEKSEKFFEEYHKRMIEEQEKSRSQQHEKIFLTPSLSH